MKKIIRLTESDLTILVKRVIKENIKNNSLHSDIMGLIRNSNSSHEETIDVLNSIVDEMSSSRRLRRDVEKRFRDDMNENKRIYNKITIKLKEAITDTPSKSYSNIFEPNGKIKKEVKSKIEEGIEIIKKNFPDLKIDDYYLVGAAVTLQYGEDSDIDTTVVVSPDTEKDYLHKVDKWVEKYLDAKFYYDNRPYQFKLSFKTRDNLDSADSAYDVKVDNWIKKPDYEKTMSMYNNKISNTKSDENKIYYGFEKFVQRSLKKLQQSLIDNKDENDIIRNMKLAYSKYGEISKVGSEKVTDDNQEGFIKKFRSSAYSREIEPGYVSQNWGKGNVIYKMFENEGYLQVFNILKDIIKNGTYGDEKLRQHLKTALEKVTEDEIGFKI